MITGWRFSYRLWWPRPKIKEKIYLESNQEIKRRNKDFVIIAKQSPTKNRVELKRKVMKSNILNLILFFDENVIWFIEFGLMFLLGFDPNPLCSMYTIVLLSRLLFAFQSVKYSFSIQYNHRLRLTFLLAWISRWLPRNVRSSLQSHDTFVLV